MIDAVSALGGFIVGVTLMFIEIGWETIRSHNDPAAVAPYDLSCTDCFERIDSETYEDWWDQHRRMWGWRGHGNRGVSDE